MIDDWKKSGGLRSRKTDLKDEDVFLSIECKNILLTLELIMTSECVITLTILPCISFFL